MPITLELTEDELRHVTRGLRLRVEGLYKAGDTEGASACLDVYERAHEKLAILARHRRGEDWTHSIPNPVLPDAP